MLSLALLSVSLMIGMAGYHWAAGYSWLDAFLNASMLLGGMGPIGDISRPWGKVFAAVFALYAGIVFLATSGLVLAPIVHRILHKLHLAELKAMEDAGREPGADRAEKHR